MKFNDFQEKVLTGEISKESLEIKYIGLATQNAIIDNIKSFSVSEENNGMKRINYILKELMTVLSIITNATNIVIEDIYNEDETMNIEKALEVYNFLKEHEIYSYILINGKFTDFLLMLENEFEMELNLSNTLQGVIATSLSKLINRLPSEEGMKDIIEKLPNIINNANPETLQFISQAIGWNKGIKPNRQQRRKVEKESKS